MLKLNIASALLFCGLVWSAVGQTLSNTISGTGSITITYSNTMSLTNTITETGSLTITMSNTVSNTETGSLTLTTTNTFSNTITNTISGTQSFTQSQSLSGSQSYSSTLGPRPNLQSLATPGNIACFSVFFAQPNPNYPNYQFTVIQSTNQFTTNIVVPTSNLVFVNPNYYYTICQQNVTGLQPFQQYSVQVAGYFSANNIAPLSFPVIVTLGSPIQYFGPNPAPDGTNSVNNLVCNYFPPYINCTWSTGNRNWLDAFLSFNCTRVVTPANTAFLATSYSETRVQNTGNVATLPTSASVFLPTGCLCYGALIARYSTPTLTVTLPIVTPGSNLLNAVNTNQPPIVNTPTTDTIP